MERFKLVENKSLTKQKKRVLYVAESFASGVFTYLVELTNNLCDEFEIYIAYGERKETPHNFKTYFNKKIHFIKVENFTRSISPRKDVLAFLELKKIYKKINPNIIHLNSSKAGVLGRFAFNGKKTKMFYTPHGYSFLMQNYSPVKRMIFKFIEKLCSLRQCETISCSLGEHKETLKLTSNAIYVNNGIDISELKKLVKNNEKKVLNNNKFRIFTVGRISFQKNPQLFNKIAENFPSVDFIWIGDGELKSKLTAPNIKVLGWLNRKQTISELMNANAFILTSLWEGLPMSLLEAMYLKKICLVSNVIGNKDVVHDGENGFVCDNLQEFIAKIKKVIKSDCKDITVNAYEDVIRQYNSVQMISEYRNIYKKEV